MVGPISGEEAKVGSGVKKVEKLESVLTFDTTGDPDRSTAGFSRAVLARERRER